MSRSWAGTVALAMATALFASMSAAAADKTGQSALPTDRPNILFILTNDQHTAMLEHMPTVQAELKAKGTTFANAVNTYPLCCPSRATIQRGQYAHNTNIFGNTVDTGGGYPTFDALDLEQSTVATWLDEAGYHTVHIGSYMNGFVADDFPPPPGWDYFGPKKGVEAPGAMRTDARRAVDAMQQLQLTTLEEDPFYMQIGFQAPHLPNRYEFEYDDMFAGERVPRTPAFNEEDVRDKPPYVHQRPVLSRQVNIHVSNKCQDTETNSLQQNDCEWVTALRSLQTTDQFLEDAIDHLDQTGELDNTYIFFYSDNGNHWGEHRLDEGKLAPYETDINFPLLVRGPSVRQGLTTRKLVGNHDLAPTFAALAEADTPEFVDGTSLLPLLDEDSTNNRPWRDAIFVEREWQPGWRIPRMKDPYYVPPYEAARMRSSIYVKYPDNPWTSESDPFKEYYDLIEDPYQLRNQVFYGTVGRWKIERAKTLLRALRKCEGPDCAIAEGFPAD